MPCLGDMTMSCGYHAVDTILGFPKNNDLGTVIGAPRPEGGEQQQPVALARRRGKYRRGQAKVGGCRGGYRGQGDKH